MIYKVEICDMLLIRTLKIHPKEMAALINKLLLPGCVASVVEDVFSSNSLRINVVSHLVCLLTSTIEERCIVIIDDVTSLLGFLF